MLDFNKQNSLNLSFISENGSSVHGLDKIHQNLPKKVLISRSKNEIQKIYDKNVSLDLKNKTAPILDLNIEEQKKIFGLPIKKLSLATKRMHSIPILFKGTEVERNNFLKVINDIGLTAQSGGRIINICDNTNKSKAMSKTLQLIRKELKNEIIAICVGDNENDIEMLKQADFPCLVKNENFDSSSINIDNLIKSNEPSPKGWSDVIKSALQKI